MAKQVALYRFELTFDLYDDDEIRSFYEDDIVNPDAERREEITFETWVQEYLLHGVSHDEDNEDPQRPRSLTAVHSPKRLHEMPSQNYDWAARQPHAHRVARMTKLLAPAGAG